MNYLGMHSYTLEAVIFCSQNMASLKLHTQSLFIDFIHDLVSNPFKYQVRTSITLSKQPTELTSEFLTPDLLAPPPPPTNSRDVVAFCDGANAIAKTGKPTACECDCECECGFIFI